MRVIASDIPGMRELVSRNTRLVVPAAPAGTPG